MGKPAYGKVKEEIITEMLMQNNVTSSKEIKLQWRQKEYTQFRDIQW